jgi:hypothetical protein
MLRATRAQAAFLRAYASGLSFEQACDQADVPRDFNNRMSFLNRMWTNGWLSVAVTDAGTQAAEAEHGTGGRVDG